MNTTPVLKPNLMYERGNLVEVTDEYWNDTCPVLLEQFELWADSPKVRDAFARVVSGAFGPSTAADLMLYAGIDHATIEEVIAYVRSVGYKEPTPA